MAAQLQTDPVLQRIQCAGMPLLPLLLLLLLLNNADVSYLNRLSFGGRSDVRKWTAVYLLKEEGISYPESLFWKTRHGQSASLSICIVARRLIFNLLLIIPIYYTDMAGTVWMGTGFPTG